MIKGVGVDIVEIGKIDEPIKRWGDRFLRRIFTEKEIKYCRSHQAGSVHFAGKFAAKECVLKALGTGWQNGIHFKQIEVLNGSLGAPQIQLFEKAKEKAQELGIKKLHLSISHNARHAVSTVVAEGE